MIKNIPSVFLFVFTTLSYSQVLNFSIIDSDFKIDESNSLILSHIYDINDYSDLSIYQEINIMFGSEEYSVISNPDSFQYSGSYLVSDGNKEFTLYFTQLPIISIDTDNVIIDDPKVLASFSYTDEEQTIISSYIGIELRGGFSKSYPKKTYDIEFWEDEEGDDTKDMQFGDLRKDDDWILDALYNEPLRVRSYTSHKLWLDMHQPYYLEDEPKAKSGADVKYIEMFLNGVYNGVYMLSEQVDKRQLKIKSYKDEIRGELYKGADKGATTFRRLPDFDNNVRSWGGHEMKFPKEKDATDWRNVYDFTDFVINSEDSDFENNIWNYFYYENYLDYFIFLNVLRATDNRGQNIYLGKYKTDEPYFYIPWDLDGCFGTIWDGSNKNITKDIMLNGFYDRVITLDVGNYTTDINQKWEGLRSDILSLTSLENRLLDSYNYLVENNVYEREAIVYPNYNFDQLSLDYMLNWLNNRLEYLDTYFTIQDSDDTPPEIEIEDDVIEPEIIKENEEPTLNLDMFLYPNPVTDFIYIKNFEELKNKHYKIFDVNQRIIKEGVLTESSISVSNIPSGLYLFKLDKELYKLVIR